jgi:hypothetical protein
MATKRAGAANLLFVIFFSLAVQGNDFNDNDFSDDGVVHPLSRNKPTIKLVRHINHVPCRCYRTLLVVVALPSSNGATE